ncbi:MAG: hypothetical protein J4G05_11915 [Chlorobi bacterium]|nr:hypothetical protein [Chlorobiota bacterium]
MVAICKLTVTTGSTRHNIPISIKPTFSYYNGTIVARGALWVDGVSG